MYRIIVPSKEYSSYGTYEQRNMESYFNCLSSENEYVPTFCLSSGKRISVANKADFIYSANEYKNTFSTRKVDDFVCRLDYGFQQRIHLMSRVITDKYSSGAGSRILYEKDSEPPVYLMAMCIKSKSIFSVNKANPELNAFVLLIDNKFIQDENHFKVFRNVKKKYIEKVQAAGVDIIYTNDLKDRCFRETGITPPKFTSVDQMLAHSKKISEDVVQALKLQVS